MKKTFFLLPIITGFLFVSGNLFLTEKTVQSQNTDTQNNQIKPVLLKPSTILEDLDNYKKAKPQISAKELADFGNSQLLQKGFNYDISICDVIQSKIKSKAATEIKGKDEYSPMVSFPYQMILTNSTKQTFQIIAPNYDFCCCGYCYTEFPVLKITAREMTLVANGKTYPVKRTTALSVSQEYILVDNKTKQKAIRRWQVPYETYPFGISQDGTKLYIDLDENELLLEISDKGIIKFVQHNHPNIITNGKDLRDSPKPKVGEILNKSGEFGYYLFKSGNTRFIIEFPYPCT